MDGRMDAWMDRLSAGCMIPWDENSDEDADYYEDDDDHDDDDDDDDDADDDDVDDHNL